MALKFYETPFHVTDTPEIASKNALKTNLTIMIRDIIDQLGWTEIEAAEKLQLTQSDFSNLINGEIDEFTLDILFSMLDLLGFKAKFTFGNIDQASIEIQRMPLTV